jgi:hypothetical protein
VSRQRGLCSQRCVCRQTGCYEEAEISKLADIFGERGFFVPCTPVKIMGLVQRRNITTWI